MDLHVVILVLIGLLGILVQILLKVRALRRRTANLVINVSLTQYIKDEWDNIMLSVVALVIAGILYDQAVKSLNPAIAQMVMNYSRILFITVGYMGASFLSALLGRTEKLVNDEISAISKNQQS